MKRSCCGRRSSSPSDVNVLVYAHRDTSPDHERYLGWLRDSVGRETPIGIADVVASGFLRIVTHPRIFATPTPIEAALAFVESLRAQPHSVVLAPGRRHWEIFARLCREVGARGNLVPGAYIAALAIESGSELATADRGFARFPALRWRHPLD